MGRLSKWGEGGNEIEPFCVDSKKEFAQRATYFQHEENKAQRNHLTSFQLEDVMDKDKTRKQFSEVQL